MDIDVFQPGEIPTVMRVLRTALAPQGALSARERAFLDTYGRIVGHALPASDPQPIAPGYVAIEGAHPRKRLVQLSALAVLLNSPVKEASLGFLKALGRHLGTHDAVIDVIEALHQGKRMKLRMLVMRRVFRVMVKEAFTAEGALGVARLFAAMLLNAPVNRDKHSKYRRLGLLPEGTLGREYWKHMTEVGFGFPGEPGGIADSVAYHDVAHVLAANDITPLGEIQQGSFQAGNRREDGFFFIQFVVLQFHHGIKITPVAPPDPGHFDPAQVLWAIHRGAQCNVDMTHQWDFWPLMALPIDEARRKVGLIGKLPVAHELRRAA